jgi:tetratricopeptide (TPR) repeat protein
MKVKYAAGAVLVLATLAQPARAGAAVPLPRQQNPGGDLATYWRIVDEYRAGNLEEAARDLSAFRPRLRRALDELARRVDNAPGGDASWSTSQVRAAAVMHTHLALAGLIELHTEQTESLAFAKALVDLKDRRRRDPDEAHVLPASFRRRWYLWVAWSAHDRFDLELLAWSIDPAEERFPEDAEVLLTAASFAETLAWPRLEAMGIDRSWVRRRGTPPQLLDRAETKLRRVLAVAPDLAEARLRLGRVLHERERPNEALEALAPLFARSDSRIAYLARLFAGAAFEVLRRPSDAVAQYRAALDLRPDLATPHVALSHLLHALGAVAEARSEAEKALNARADADDPWWTYYYGQGPQAGRLGLQLIEEARE